MTADTGECAVSGRLATAPMNRTSAEKVSLPRTRGLREATRAHSADRAPIGISRSPACSADMPRADSSHSVSPYMMT